MPPVARQRGEEAAVGALAPRLPRFLALGLLAVGTVAGALWLPAQLWPASQAPNRVYGLVADASAPTGLAAVTALQPRAHRRADPTAAVARAATTTSGASQAPLVPGTEPLQGDAADAADTADTAGAACALLLPRLPGVSRAQCLATQLQASGAQSRQGAPLYWRDVIYHPAAPARTFKNQPGLGPLRVLVVGAMHGDELTAASLALRWIGMASAEGTGVRPSPALPDGPQGAGGVTAPPAPVHWRFIPVLNPDGLLAPRPTRVNASGVDLNRNFPTPGWAEEAPVYWEKRTRKDPRRWPGHTPLSEPESRFLHQQMDQFQPQLVVSIHAPYGVLDFDGPHDPPARLGRLRMDKLGVFPGSLGHYGGLHRGVPVVTIELEHALSMPPDAEVRAMWRDLRHWMNTRLLHGADAVAGVTPPGLQR